MKQCNNSRIILLAILLCSAVFLAACNNLLDNPDGAAGTGKALVSISIDGSPSRTVVPGADPANYTYRLFGSTGDEAQTQRGGDFDSNGTTLGLPPAENWNFTLRAYDNNGIEVLRGSVSNKVLVSGETNQVVFDLALVQDADRTGSIAITVNFPGDTNITHAKVSTDIPGFEDETVEITEPGTWEYQKEGVSAGDYSVVIAFYRENSENGVVTETFMATVTEIVKVGGGLVSAKTITLSAADFKVLVAQGGRPQEKLDWINTNAQRNAKYIVNINTSDTLAPFTFSGAYLDGAVITLAGTGEETVNLSAQGSMFTVPSGVTLVLENITLEGRDDNTAALVNVGSGGTLTLNYGAVITKNTNTSDPAIPGPTSPGGGVYVRGTLIMNGGSRIDNNNAYQGGGVFVDSSGILNKTGGTIYGNDDAGTVNANTAGDGTESGRGHAVYIDSRMKYRDNTAGEDVDLDSATDENWDSTPFPGTIEIRLADGSPVPAAGVPVGTTLAAVYTSSGSGSGTSVLPDYKWFKGGTAIAGATGETITASEGGSYTVLASFAGYQNATSGAVNVDASAIPTAAGLYSITGNSVLYRMIVDSDGDGIPDSTMNNDISAALGYIGTVSNEGDYLMVLDSNYTVTTGLTIPAMSVLTLRGTGGQREISFDESTCFFVTETGAGLTLDANITLRGNSGNTVPLVTVESYGSLTMNEGSVITGNTNKGNVIGGGGVRVVGSGIFTMNGGEISGNTATGEGGGVYVSGTGTFTMKGGKISGNTAEEVEGAGKGGGVYFWGDTFTMEGGTVSGNTANSGGGVYIDTNLDSGTTFIKTGGTIYGSNETDVLIRNTANAGNTKGHAVYVYVDGTATNDKYQDNTTGGDIDLNSATDTNWDSAPVDTVFVIQLNMHEDDLLDQSTDVSADSDFLFQIEGAWTGGITWMLDGVAVSPNQENPSEYIFNQPAGNYEVSVFVSDGTQQFSGSCRVRVR